MSTYLVLCEEVTKKKTTADIVAGIFRPSAEQQKSRSVIPEEAIQCQSRGPVHISSFQFVPAGPTQLFLLFLNPGALLFHKIRAGWPFQIRDFW